MAKKRNKIRLRTPEEIKQHQVACEAARDVLLELKAAVIPGVTTGEVNELAKGLIAKTGGKATFYNYRGFPGHICISKNEVIVHGIGNDEVIEDGDIVSIDVGVTLNGWIGDNATTVPVGAISEETKRLLAATEESLYRAIDFARPGNKLADLCGSVADFVEPLGFSIVREFVGHGVGKELHEEPQIPNFRPAGSSPTLKPGMVLAIEPMVNAGTPKMKILSDGWTAITKDKKYSAHFEHTVAVTEDEPLIMTARPREATLEQLGLSSY